MPYEVNGSGPQTWNIALNLEHWDKGAFHFFAPATGNGAGVEGGRLRNGLRQE